MTTPRIGRRTFLGGAAGLGAVGALGAGTVLDPAAAAGGSGPMNPQGSRRVAPSLVGSSLPALLSDEQAQLFFAADLWASTSSSAGSGPVYVAGLTGCYPSGGTGWLGITPVVPVGSLLTGMDFIINGGPRTGLEAGFVDYHEPDSVGFIGTLGQAAFSAGTGVETQSIALNNHFTGKEVYEGYFAALSSTSVARGIRVRYLPPASGFVAVGAKTVYDSKSASVGTTAKSVIVAGKAGVPAGARAVVLNVRVSQATANGSVQVRPYGKKTSTWDEQYLKGQTMSHLCIVAIESGRVQVRVSRGKARVAMTVSGYFQS